MGKGVLNVGSKCAVTVDIDGTKVRIGDGVIVFDSGVKIKVTGYEELDIIGGVKNYVYAVYDASENKAYLNVSDVVPSGDFVLLAEISAAGVVTDKRDWAMMKNGSVLPNSTLIFDKTDSIQTSDDTCTFDFTINLGDYINSKFVIIKAVFGKKNGIQLNREIKLRLVVDLISKKINGYFYNRGQYSTTEYDLCYDDDLSKEIGVSTYKMKIELNVQAQTMRLYTTGAFAATDIPANKSFIITCI